MLRSEAPNCGNILVFLLTRPTLTAWLTAEYEVRLEAALQLSSSNKSLSICRVGGRVSSLQVCGGEQSVEV